MFVAVVAVVAFPVKAPLSVVVVTEVGVIIVLKTPFVRRIFLEFKYKPFVEVTAKYPVTTGDVVAY
jgi:hypothetical protein